MRLRWRTLALLLVLPLMLVLGGTAFAAPSGAWSTHLAGTGGPVRTTGGITAPPDLSSANPAVLPAAPPRVSAGSTALGSGGPAVAPLPAPTTGPRASMVELVGPPDRRSATLRVTDRLRDRAPPSPRAVSTSPLSSTSVLLSLPVH